MIFRLLLPGAGGIHQLYWLDTVIGPRDNKPAAKCDLRPNLELDKSAIGRGEEMILFGLPHLALREIAAQTYSRGLPASDGVGFTRAFSE